MTIRLRHPFPICILAALLLAGCGGQGAAITGNTATGGGSSSPTSTPTSPTPPTINLTGTPAQSVTAGSLYMFQPSVSATSGTVTFSIAGLPKWANFNASTGELTGTPSAAQVGMTSLITITASDGATTASVGPFTIDVKAAPVVVTGSASLTWMPPAQNTDGTPVTDLAGYHIHYGTSVDELTQTIDVPGGTTTTYVIANLTQGTYYFTITAYNAEGVESAASNVASNTM